MHRGTIHCLEVLQKQNPIFFKHLLGLKSGEHRNTSITQAYCIVPKIWDPEIKIIQAKFKVSFLTVKYGAKLIINTIIITW